VRMNLANALMRQGELDKAIAIYREALAILPAGSDESTRANLLVNMAECLSRMGKADTAVQVARSGIALAATVGSKEILMNG
ncbi:MAG: tetratricopeptide repeat protein, partial [Flavobacteriales bacterium]|nr:tetratricopeptide repeat protein [Flavobacteriales bacterium]